MKAQEKRKPRSYKAKETPYCKAVRRAWAQGTTLAAILETVVVNYANPQYHIMIVSTTSNRSIKSAIFDMKGEIASKRRNKQTVKPQEQ